MTFGKEKIELPQASIEDSAALLRTLTTHGFSSSSDSWELLPVLMLSFLLLYQITTYSVV